MSWTISSLGQPTVTVYHGVHDTFFVRHSFRDDVSKSLASVAKEEHQRRMKSLRKELDYLDKTAWQFEPIEKLLGQN